MTPINAASAVHFDATKTTFDAGVACRIPDMRNVRSRHTISADA